MPTSKKKLAFDNKKYLKVQRQEILKRIKSFGGKLYLEFGGKLFDDFHASRVLPGFEPDSKLQMLLTLKDDAEIVMAVNADDIKFNKVRNDLGITYESEVERLIDAYQAAGLYVSSVVLCFYHVIFDVIREELAGFTNNCKNCTFNWVNNGFVSNFDTFLESGGER